MTIYFEREVSVSISFDSILYYFKYFCLRKKFF